MTKRVSFARPTRGSASGAAATATKSSGVGGRGVVPPKGGTTTPLTQSRLSLDENEKENGEAKVTWLVREIESLSIVHRKQLLAQLALMAQQGTSKDDRDLDMWATSVYEALGAALGSESGAGQGPLVVKRVLSPQSNWGPVADFMASSGLGKETVAKRQAIYRLLARLVVRRAKLVASYTRAPLSAKFVANVAHDVRAIFEAEFPGYLASGYASLVAAQLGKPSPHGNADM